MTAAPAPIESAAVRRAGWAADVLFVLTASAPAWVPLTRARPPTTAHREIEIARVETLLRAAADGWFYPRLDPDAVLGLGSPALTLEPPLGRYVAALVAAT